ncbi:MULTISPECIES: hypothetical protein [unclassified Knoellia]|uniref:hypothetical protein n=1 Tax=Knoellia altitudinis TaxID=3404795 RepID=UPI0036082C4E
MSYQPPRPPGPHAHAGQVRHGAPSPYAGHPAYGGIVPPAPPSRGLNPWLAAALGAIGGVLLTVAAGAMLWVATGGPLPWEGVDDLAQDWRGQVDVAGDGSVPGPALADAVLEVGGGGYYEEVVCPATPRAAEDVTTLCRVDDGYDQYRVVVVFLDDSGRFETAEVFSQ